MTDILVFWSFVLSFLFITLLVIFTHYVLRAERGDILNIIRADFWVPSLSLFQFFVWTLVIAFVFLGFYLIRILNGELSDMPVIPSNILVLLGISVAVPIVSTGYTKKVYSPETPKKPPEKLPPFSMMLQQGGKVTLTRFQMFLWTFIGIAIYLSTVWITISGISATTPIADLSIPNIDPTLVYLMGLSQAGYLGGRLVTEKPKEKEKPAAAIEKPPITKPAVGETPLSPEPAKPKHHPMTEGVRKFLVAGHSSEVKEKLLIKITESEIHDYFRYYLIGHDFYYLIENGQIRGSGKGSIVEIMDHINSEKKEIGPAELIKIFQD